MDKFDKYEEHFARSHRTDFNFKEANLASWPQHASQWLPQDKDAKIVDLGCGFGQQMLVLWNLGYRNLTGVDISAGQLKVARENLPDEINLVEANVEDFIKEYENQFNLVLASHLLEHMSKKEGLQLAHGVHNAMSGDGTFVITVPNASCLLSNCSIAKDFTHQTAYTAESLFYLLNLAGFSEYELLQERALVDLRYWRPYLPWKGLKLRKHCWRLLHKLLLFLRGIGEPLSVDPCIWVQAHK